MGYEAKRSDLELRIMHKIQLWFPRGIIDVRTLEEWDECSVEIMTGALVHAFWEDPMPLLRLVDVVTVSLKTEMFVAREKFVAINYVGDYFMSWLMDKVELPSTNNNILYCNKLRKKCYDSLIFKELGGEYKAETTLATVFALLEKQPNCEDGILGTDGCSNIFYIRGINDVLYSVRCYVESSGWCVDAYPIDSDIWLDDDLVFVCNSSGI